MSEHKDLLPCPFCGHDAEIKHTGKNKMRVRCRSCLMGIEQRVLKLSVEWLEKTLIESWNKRI